MKLTFRTVNGRIIPVAEDGKDIDNVTFASIEQETGQPARLSLIVTIDHANQAPDIQAPKCKAS